MRKIVITEELILGKTKIPAGSTITVNESIGEIEDRTVVSCKNNTNTINGHKFIRPTYEDLQMENNWIIYHFPTTLKSNNVNEQAVELVKISWKTDSWSKELSDFFDNHDLDFDSILFVDLDMRNIDSIITNKYELSQNINKINKENKIPVVAVECNKTFLQFINTNNINIIELSEKMKLDIIVQYLTKHTKRVYRTFQIGE